MSKKIIYIMSDVRSGSTLLQNILSKSNEIISVGELHNLDSHIHKGALGKTWGWKCSCGSEFENCNFWKNVFLNLKNDGIKTIDKTSVSNMKSRIEYLFTNNNSDISYTKNAKMLKQLNSIYTAIFKSSGCKVIIDSSKHPIQGLTIYKNINYDIKIIYLKRDIRAVVTSKQKWNKKFNTSSPNKYRTLLISKLYEYLILKCLRKIDEADKITINYKSLSVNPQNTVDLIINKFQLKKFEAPEYMFLENDHTIGGTPNRFKKRKIKYDSVWEMEVSKKPIFNLIGGLLNYL